MGEVRYLCYENEEQNLLLPFLFFAFIFAFTLSCNLHVHAVERTWHSVQEPSSQERKNLDLSTQSPRDLQRPYLPAEKFPFAAPYSAEETGLRVMEFPHTPLWNCLLIDIGTTITPEGFLDQQISTSAVLYLPQRGFPAQLSDMQPGQELFRWISQSVNSPYPDDTAIRLVAMGENAVKGCFA